MKYTKRDALVTNVASFVTGRMEFLNPRQNSIADLDTACEIIKKAVKQSRHIHIVGDYDVDGICSSTILKKGITEAFFYTNILVRLPRRFSEGYGLNPKIVEEIPDNSLLITVDNGIVAFEAIELAKSRGMTVIVVDHHLPSDDGRLPMADVIIDPNAIKGQCEFAGYCGSGLALKLIKTLNSHLKCNDELEGLAAIATLADVVPLVNENYLIAQNYKKAVANKGLKALMLQFELNVEHMTEKDIGFKICPALNASGRLYDNGAMQSFSLLNDDSESVLDKAISLFNTNEERKERTDNGMTTAEEIIEQEALYGDTPLCVAIDGFDEGLVGILAGKLAEKYRTPTFVFSVNEDGICKGSGRTYGNTNLKGMLDGCKSLLLKYGGHAAAAGVTLDMKNLNEFREKTRVFVAEVKEDEIIYDLEISASMLKCNFENILNLLRTASPFGEGNPEPVFKITEVQLYPKYGAVYKTMGSDNQHIKLFGDGVDYVGFGMAKDFLGRGANSIISYGMLGLNWYMETPYKQIELKYFDPIIKDTIKTAASERLAAFAKGR